MLLVIDVLSFVYMSYYWVLGLICFVWAFVGGDLMSECVCVVLLGG